MEVSGYLESVLKLSRPNPLVSLSRGRMSRLEEESHPKKRKETPRSHGSSRTRRCLVVKGERPRLPVRSD